MTIQPLQDRVARAALAPRAQVLAIRLVAALSRFARAAGTAFQIRDDHLGVFGEPGSTGKSVVGDLLHGKASLLLAHARAEHPAAVERALECVGRPGGPERVRAVPEQTGSRAYCQDRIDRLQRDAVAALGNVPEPLREHLLAFSRSTSARTW